jgi:DNA-binding transcriptional regulator YiaG
VTATEFRAALATLGKSQVGFAVMVGANERTVRRWASGDQIIPQWVPLLVETMTELARHKAARASGA